MKRLRQLILRYRYLALACLVPPAAVFFLIFPQPSQPSKPHPDERPLTFRGKFEKIEDGMSENQVREILGQPLSEIQIGHDMGALWKWREDRDTVVVSFCTFAEHPFVMGKQFLTKLENPEPTRPTGTE
jgi:hypothetical protein